jgi:hypothetical protein
MTKPKVGPGTVVVDGETYATETIEYRGELFTIRELSADESADIEEVATGPGPAFEFNGRLNSRMLLSKSLVEPEVTVDGIGKYPGVKYLTLLKVFNKLNSLPEANPTVPAGSAGQTSPASGEPTQQL